MRPLADGGDGSGAEIVVCCVVAPERPALSVRAGVCSGACACAGVEVGAAPFPFSTLVADMLKRRKMDVLDDDRFCSLVITFPEEEKRCCLPTEGGRPLAGSMLELMSQK